MIFYFSGTGNSHAAALELCKMTVQTNDRAPVSITECMREERLRFQPETGEAVVIVCPVYFGGLPTIVREFIASVIWDPAPDYLCGVLTYGGRLMDAGGMLRDDLRKQGYELSAIFSVQMPANYCVLYEPPGEEETAEILGDAESCLLAIGKSICERKKLHCISNKKDTEDTAALYPQYEQARNTSPFWVDDKCISCGVCAGRCPVEAIKLVAGVPTWVKEKCVHCMSCARCGAIQYGESTVGRRRYRHPIYQKKAAPTCH